MNPIEPYLIELLRAFEADGFTVIIAGGLGIYLKRRWIHQTERTTLFMPPDARATDDIDSFTRLEIFAPDLVTRFRGVLDRLGYRATDTGKYLQFVKPAKGVGLDDKAKFDLHARLPEPAEGLPVKQRTSGKLIRLGHPNNRAWNTLNAWGTVEAFAVEEGVQELPLAGLDPTGATFTGVVRVPHPFASLCMKIRAAADDQRTPIEQRVPLKRKHAFDVYLLVAMLDEQELTQAHRIAEKFSSHPEMAKLRTDFAECFATPEAGACLVAREQLREQPGEPTHQDMTRFCAVLRELFGA